MTATATRLYSRDEVADFESSEIDGRSESWLSPYAIPSELTISLDDKGLRIVFRYHGGESAGEPGPVDDAVPPVLAALGLYTRKVMVVRVELDRQVCVSLPHPADAAPLMRAVAERLVTAAEHRSQQSERLSLRLTGKLIRDMASRLVGAEQPAPTVRSPNRQAN